MGVFAGPNTIVTNGLVLALDAGNIKSYPGSGSIWSDFSISQNTGILINGPTYNSSNGGCIEFDGTNDNCSLLNIPPINGNEITFCLWNYGIDARAGSVIWLSGTSGISIDKAIDKMLFT